MARAALPRRAPGAARRRAGREARGALRRAARARRRSASISLVNTNVVDEIDDRAGARRRGASCRSSSDIDPDDDPDGARHARADHVRQDAQGPRRRARTSAAVHVVCGDPFDTAGARRPARHLRQAGGGERRRPAIASSTPSTASTSARPAASELESDDAQRRRGGGERHPRLRRRGARHPLGQLALLAGDEGARERHPHRAGGEGGHRPLPHRRRALRRAARAARRS